MINCLKELLYAVLAQNKVIQSLPLDIHNDIFAPSANEIRTLVEELVDAVNQTPIQLEHCPLTELFYSYHKDIIDFLFGNEWLDVGILQVWCT